MCLDGVEGERACFPNTAGLGTINSCCKKKKHGGPAFLILQALIPARWSELTAPVAAAALPISTRASADGVPAVTPPAARASVGTWALRSLGAKSRTDAAQEDEVRQQLLAAGCVQAAIWYAADRQILGAPCPLPNGDACSPLTLSQRRACRRDPSASPDRNSARLGKLEEPIPLCPVHQAAQDASSMEASRTRRSLAGAFGFAAAGAAAEQGKPHTTALLDGEAASDASRSSSADSRSRLVTGGFQMVGAEEDPAPVW
jgi:hypothetical protein